jgi:hypothetical protein
MISCEKAQTICTKTQYREASLYEKAQLFIHILYCKACAEFSRKNKRLTELMRRAAAKPLSGEEKNAMKQQLKQAE